MMSDLLALLTRVSRLRRCVMHGVAPEAETHAARAIIQWFGVGALIAAAGKRSRLRELTEEDGAVCWRSHEHGRILN